MGDDTAVSPVIGTLLILATFAVVVTTVITVGRPQIVDYQERGEFQTVVNQMTKLAADQKQLAVSGNMNEIQHPTLKLPKGSLQFTEGHFMAASIGYRDQNYSAVIGETSDPWEHPDVYIAPASGQGPEWDPGDTAVEVYWQMPNLLNPSMYGLLDRWEGDEWVRVGQSSTNTIANGDPFPVIPFQDSSGAGKTLREGPWRFSYWFSIPLADDELAAEVYIYDQTRLMYRYDGESGPRHAYAENGAIFVYEHNQYRLTRASLLAAPKEGVGSNSLTLRVAILNADEGGASGRSDIGFIMRMTGHEQWVQGGGAMVTRLQIHGPYADLWTAHLKDRGYLADADPAKGLYHVDDYTNAGEHTVYPANVIWSEIDLRVRSR